MAINDVIAHLDPDQGEGLEGYITAEDVKASLYDLYNLIITTISEGPIGPQGIQGPLGPQGIAGPVGPTGPAPTFDVGTVETGTADVSLSGNESTGYHLNLVLPSAGADGVNTAAIQNGAVTSEKIANGSIQNEDIAADADIDRSKIAGTALTTASMSIFNVLDYGALGDSTTDDTDAIEAAVAAAAAVNGEVVFPRVADSGSTYYKGYRTTVPVVVPLNVSVIMHSPIYYTGAAGGAALTIGAGAPTDETNRRHVVRVIRPPVGGVAYDWASATDIGVVLRNQAGSNIEIADVRGFTIGAQLLGDGGGFFYNVVQLGRLNNCKYGLDFETVTTGCVTENLLLGGLFSVDSDVNLSVSRYGVRIRSTPTELNNGNIFHKPSFEIGLNITGGAEAVPILISDGANNRFYDIRNEGNSALTVRTSGKSRDNYVSVAYSEAAGVFSATNMVDDQGARPTTIIEPSWLQVFHRANRTVAHIPNLPTRIVQADNQPTHNIPGLVFAYYTTDDWYQFRGGVTVTADYLHITAATGIGLLMDTTRARRFVVDRSVVAGYGGRVVVRCYNAAGTQLDPATSPYDVSPMVKFFPFAGEATTSWGGAYTTSADTDDPVGFAVTHADVASVGVIVTGSGGENLRFTGLHILTDSIYPVNTWTPFPDNSERAMGYEIPTGGIHRTGQIIWRAEPVTGEPMGWMCTAGGTPGTWKAMGNLA